MTCTSLKRMFQGTILGHIIYTLSKGRVLKYKEDYSDFVPPEKFLLDSNDIEKAGSSFESTQSDPILLTFEGPDDPYHPHSWPWWVKLIVGLGTSANSSLVYIAAVAFMPAKSYLMEEFNIGETAAVLPLSLFVYGYAIGPMVFSPLSEHPVIGRNFFYASTLFACCLVQIGSALVHNFAGLCILRFISGFLISPVLATGGASYADMFSTPYVPHAMVLWGFGSYSGNSLGPLFGACFSVATHDWRWSFWFLAICCGVLGLFFLCVVPETYNDTILYRRAERLKRVTGNKNITIYPSNQILRANHSIKEILWRPVVIGFTEPVVMMINVYIALVYGIMYLWLEGFPILFEDVKGFAPVPLGAAYIVIFIGVIFGGALYSALLWKPFTQKVIAGEKVYPEVFTPVAIVGSLFMPTGIFIFGWTGARDIHWSAPLIGAALYGVSGIILFQSLLSYIGASFPRYIASAFAGNNLVRSLGAGSFPLFGRALFMNLHNNRFPVAWGSTIVGVIAVLMVSIPVLFYLNGPKLRAKSPYSSL
ncbi:Multidrug resistance protein 1 [Cyberlindnera fabianii]|uniref:Multidrug resistance protein 1 n=1 Tax=Cyberlindnera fabianii TaxID=36022 RepID=A0A1V2L1C9_CYBFA|nr:Multidrug resistance protein 1 [Cyberlindnera fabianii]